MCYTEEAPNAWHRQGTQHMWLCVGLLCLLRGVIVMESGLVSLGLQWCLRLSSAGLNVVLVPECCWAYSAFSV